MTIEQRANEAAERIEREGYFAMFGVSSGRCRDLATAIILSACQRSAEDMRERCAKVADAAIRCDCKEAADKETGWYFCECYGVTSLEAIASAIRAISTKDGGR